MAEYRLNWITTQLAVGYAPMSYEELDSLKRQGINAILNLCAEFCDLHEIEEQAGFEVYYLPVQDEGVPDMEEMEKALAWLDEAIYLGKKVLVHCRHGIGRTGTFVTAYLIRRGLGLKLATKKMELTYATPANYEQWRLLRKYGKKTGELKIREPSLEGRRVVDLADFFAEYEAIAQGFEEKREGYRRKGRGYEECGLDSDFCCHEGFEIKFIEAVYINNKLNKILTSKERLEIIARAAGLSATIKKRLANQVEDIEDGGARQKDHQSSRLPDYLCPLNVVGKCSLYEYRPLRCRSYGIPVNIADYGLVDDMLFSISQNLFFALSGAFADKSALIFPFYDVVSGRFVQTYFHHLLKA
jgi:protein tyrosine phosphatase (PTP) superfamily phosphohydrolase (DUF442 family)